MQSFQASRTMDSINPSNQQFNNSRTYALGTGTQYPQNMNSSSYYQPRSPVTEKEKDQLINTLNSRIFELDQNDRNYQELFQKYKALQNEYQLTNEAKIRLEYELKQKMESSNKILLELKNQNDSLLIELNEKSAMNKKLYADGNNLYQNLEQKKDENSNLLNQVNENDNMINRLNQDKDQCEKEINILNDTTIQNQSNIEELNKNLDSLTLENQSNSQNLQKLSNDFGNNQRLLNNERFNNQNLISKIDNVENNLAHCNSQLDIANKAIAQLECEINDLSNNNDNTKNEFQNLSNDFQKERAIRIEAEKSNNNLETLLRNNNDKLQKLALMNDSLKMNVEQSQKRKMILLNNMEKYKEYVRILKDQIQNLSLELKKIAEQDGQMYMGLDRIEQLTDFINKNRQTLNEIDNGLSNMRASN